MPLMHNLRTDRWINVPDVPEIIQRNRSLGYEVDDDGPRTRPFRAQIPWDQDPEMPRRPRVATRFRRDR